MFAAKRKCGESSRLGILLMIIREKISRGFFILVAGCNDRDWIHPLRDPLHPLSVPRICTSFYEKIRSLVRACVRSSRDLDGRIRRNGRNFLPVFLERIFRQTRSLRNKKTCITMHITCECGLLQTRSGAQRDKCIAFLSVYSSSIGTFLCDCHYGQITLA